jgi:hypothetical protein
MEKQMTKAQGESHRHHFTPRWHLRRFAHPGRKHKEEILVYGFREKIIKPIGTMSVGRQNDFNRLEIKGEAPDWLEDQWTEKYESPARVVIDRIVETNALPDDAESLNTLIVFLALLYSRNPRQRKMTKDLRQLIWQHLGARGVQSDEYWEASLKECEREGLEIAGLERRKLADAIGKGNLTVVPLSPVATLQDDTTHADAMLRLFKAMHWKLVEATPQEEFWTSDYPVIVFPGVDKKQCCFFPISPTLGLIGEAVHGKPPRFTRENMGFLNALEAQSAEHFVVMRDPERVTLFSDAAGPQNWRVLIDGTRNPDRYLPEALLVPKASPTTPFFKKT